MNKQTVTLNKALRLKNKMIKHSVELWNRVNKYNSVLVGVLRPYDVAVAFDDYENSLKDIVTIKMAIYEKNSKIQCKIFEMAELKGEISRLRSLNTQDGIIQNSYSDTLTSEYKTIITQRGVDGFINKIQKQIDAIQEDLDQFNAQSLVEVELYTDFEKEAK